MPVIIWLRYVSPSGEWNISHCRVHFAGHWLCTRQPISDQNWLRVHRKSADFVHDFECNSLQKCHIDPARTKISPIISSRDSLLSSLDVSVSKMPVMYSTNTSKSTSLLIHSNFSDSHPWKLPPHATAIFDLPPEWKHHVSKCFSSVSYRMLLQLQVWNKWHSTWLQQTRAAIGLLDIVACKEVPLL